MLLIEVDAVRTRDRANSTSLPPGRGTIHHAGQCRPDKPQAAGIAGSALAGGLLPCYSPAMAATVLPLVKAAAQLPTRGALIGLDLGSKTIGVATSDPDRRIATAVETISRKKFSADAARLLLLASERNAAGFVLPGCPVNMDGSEGPRAQATRAFARNLARLTDLPIALWDERLSTAAVERELIAVDMSRARRAKVIDQQAAVFILQGALDRLARGALASYRERLAQERRVRRPLVLRSITLCGGGVPRPTMEPGFVGRPL